LVQFPFHIFLVVAEYILSSLSEHEAAHLQISTQEKADILEEVTTELSVYLGMLYHIIESFKGDHDSEFAEELSKFISLSSISGLT
jgi:hypothetical protein